jgi:hypothetical protein
MNQELTALKKAGLGVVDGAIRDIVAFGSTANIGYTSGRILLEVS